MSMHDVEWLARVIFDAAYANVAGSGPAVTFEEEREWWIGIAERVAAADAVGDRDRNEFQEGADLYQRGYEDALRESGADSVGDREPRWPACERGSIDMYGQDVSSREVVVAKMLATHSRNGSVYEGPYNIEEWYEYARVVLAALDEHDRARSDAVQSPGQGEGRVWDVVDGQRDTMQTLLARAESAEAEVTRLRAELAREREASEIIDAALDDRNDEVDRLRAHWDEENRRGTELIAEVETLRAELDRMTDLHDAKHRDWQRSEARCDELTEALDDITFSASIRNDDGVQALGDLADEIRAKFKLDKTGDDA